MFTDIIKTDELRRKTAAKPGPGTPSSWMSTSGVHPPPNIEQMMQILGTSPGMTPDLLRAIMQSQKNKMALQPTMLPAGINPAFGFRDYRAEV